MQRNRGSQTWVRIGAIALLLTFVVLAAITEVVQLDVNGLRPFFLVPFLFATYPVMGALILLRRGSHLVGWILAVVGIILLVMVGSGDYAAYTLLRHPGSLPFGDFAVLLDGTLWGSGLYLFTFLLPATFPTGRLLSKRWLVPLVFGVVYVAMAEAGNAFVPGHHLTDHPQIANPIGIPGHDALFESLRTLSVLPLSIALVGTIAGVVVRYRRSRGVERQQLKWFMFSIFLVPVALLFNDVPVVGQVAFVIVIPLLGISIALAVLRYGLYDIDVVINRTLVYGALAAFITAVYVGIVVGVGTLVGSGGRPNLVLSIVATAVVAVAFQPVRERLQKVANRLVYGQRATPYEVLSEFSSRVAESYAGDQVLPRMAQVLAEGTGAERAEVWLRSGANLRSAASWPVGSRGDAHDVVPLTGPLLPHIPETDRAVPVRHQGELLGMLTVTKRAGESLTPIEENLLDDLANQAGLVLKNVGLTADLQARLEDLRASRQRLVKAQDDERRKLERNLHDGAQQNLVALKVKLGLAETFTETNPARARELVVQLKADADEALETLRDLARGIYPPLLEDRGLVAALESQARKATVPFEVRAIGVGRYPQETEAAVYFCCLEAIQNVQKYAAAANGTVRLQEKDGSLTFAVEDDGNGFDPGATPAGSGLRNMADRIDALGGQLRVESTPGAGTQVSGQLPVAVGTVA